MKIAIQIFYALILSLAPSIYYFNFIYFDIFYINSLYFVGVLSLLIFLNNTNFKNFNNGFYISFLIFLIFFGLLFSYLIHSPFYGASSNTELIRFLAYFVFFVVAVSLIEDYGSIKYTIHYASYIYVFLAAVSLLFILIFGFDAHNALIQRISFEDEDIISAHTIFSENLNFNRFTIPGLNSNSVAILSSLFSAFFINRILQTNRYKFLNYLCLYILILSVFLTLSRQGFIYLFILFVFYIIHNRRQILYIISPLILGLFFADYSIIYYRLLSLIDALFSSSYSSNLINNSSERENLIYDSISHLSQSFWGSSLEKLYLTFPGATGEHLLYFYLTSLYGYFVGISFFLLNIFLIFKVYARFKMNIFYSYTSLMFFYFSVICFVSSFFSPAYYLNLSFLSLSYIYFSSTDSLKKDAEFSVFMRNNKLN